MCILHSVFKGSEYTHSTRHIDVGCLFLLAEGGVEVEIGVIIRWSTGAELDVSRLLHELHMANSWNGGAERMGKYMTLQTFVSYTSIVLIAPTGNTWRTKDNRWTIRHNLPCLYTYTTHDMTCNC